MAKAKTADFENSIKQLESLVKELERGDLSLEDSLKAFEKGVALTSSCQKALDAAEKRVKILVENNGSSSLEDFETEDLDD